MAPTMTTGIDLGDRKSHVCVLNSDGQVFWRGELPSTRDGAETFLRGFTAARAVMEVSTHSRWVSAIAAELGHEVIVANPAHVRLIYASNTKTDQFDAEGLARLARVDVALLHPVRHRSRTAQAATCRATGTASTKSRSSRNSRRSMRPWQYSSYRSNSPARSVEPAG